VGTFHTRLQKAVKKMESGGDRSAALMSARLGRGALILQQPTRLKRESQSREDNLESSLRFNEHDHENVRGGTEQKKLYFRSLRIEEVT
jgi:hypothetical protein